MSNSYLISSQNTANPFNALMVEVKGGSGTSKIPVKPIEQYYQLSALNIIAGVEKFLNLDTINFDYIIRSIYWCGEDINTSNDIIFKMYDEEVLLSRFSINASLHNGFQPAPFPFSPTNRISVTSDFLISRLILIIEPAIILDKIRID